MAMEGYVGLCKAMFGCVRLSRTMQGNVKLCMAM